MIYIIIGIVVLTFLYFLKIYNKLITLRNKAMNQKSQIDIELKRRFDLVPNLVEVVKGYAKYEESTLEQIVKARNNYISASSNTVEALGEDNNLSGALARIFALTESYPELKANTNFLSLQKDLSSIEQKIVYARQFYNDSIYKLNTEIEKFPSNIVANLFNFTKEPFFEAKGFERDSVEVKV